jgi:uridine kinase
MIRLASADNLAAHIAALAAAGERPLVAALDGPSGAGKSTLAARLATALAEVGLTAACIPLDDFFAADIPDPCWDTFTFEERLAGIFDWHRVRASALEPLLAGRPARWHAFDFASGLRPDGTYGLLAEAEERAPAAVILLEGNMAAGPALADLVGLAVRVDAPWAERQRRLAAREDPAFLAAWHARWDAYEAWYFSAVRPPESFDLVVSGV